MMLTCKLTFNEKATAALFDLKKRLGVKTTSEVFLMALALLDKVEETKREGGEIYLEDSKGVKRRIIGII